MIEYVYSISNDFINASVDITILQTQILNETDITIELDHVKTNLVDDTCTLFFMSSLSEDEKTLLDSIITTHTGNSMSNSSNSIEGKTSDIIFSYGNETYDYYLSFYQTCYRVASQFIFRGTSILGEPAGVKILAKGLGYIRLYDQTNSNELCEFEITESNTWTIYTLTDISNWPENEAFLELQGNKTVNSHNNSNNSSGCFCSCLIIYYDSDE